MRLTKCSCRMNSNPEIADRIEYFALIGQLLSKWIFRKYSRMILIAQS